MPKCITSNRIVFSDLSLHELHLTIHNNESYVQSVVYVLWQSAYKTHRNKSGSEAVSDDNAHERMNRSSEHDVTSTKQTQEKDEKKVVKRRIVCIEQQQQPASQPAAAAAQDTETTP